MGSNGGTKLTPTLIRDTLFSVLSNSNALFQTTFDATDRKKSHDFIQGSGERVLATGSSMALLTRYESPVNFLSLKSSFAAYQ